MARRLSKTALHIYMYKGDNFSDPEYVTTFIALLPIGREEETIEKVIESFDNMISYTIAPMQPSGFFLAFHRKHFKEILNLLQSQLTITNKL